MHMIRLAALAVVFGLLGACASQQEKLPQPLQAEALSGELGSFAAGTLAPLGSFEWQISPSYTQIAVTGHNAARALREKRVAFDTALRVHTTLERAKRLLDDAVAADAKKDSATANTLAKSGADAIAEANAILRGDL